MNPRLTTAAIGLLTVILGLFALLYPELVMSQLLGFTALPSFPANFVRGEVRAAYGGLFTVLGFFTLFAAMDPAANRGRLVFIGALWLGAFAGRTFGIIVDGSPGAMGWLSAIFELIVGGVLIAASQMAPDTPQAIYDTAPPSPGVTPTAPGI